jgi:class 3 adenylate cyclase/tetratricopeptide (TPR) repeat protein
VTSCSSCSAELAPTDSFCPECGTPAQVRVCTACGATADRGRFCAQCGTPLPVAGTPATASRHPPEAERRVTSVLFADLVGFTPLSESRDAEEVRELLSQYFQVCRTVLGRYGGTVEKFIGDAVMAVWGVPVTHEDDAERSVRAGLELVEAIAALGDTVGAPGLAMRVGVVTGEVAVNVGATGEGMVAGDAVNTAARVQAAAEPGTVWVDDVTRGLTAASIAYGDVGQHALKGKAAPAHLWQARAVVAELGGGQRVDGLEAPLAGRDRDLRLLKELFHATQESARPRLVVIDGEAGVGKSRLAWEFEKYADGLTATVRWHRGRCLSYGDGVAYWALAEALRPRLGLLESESADAVAGSLDAALEPFVPDAREREWLRPRLASLLGTTDSVGFERGDLFAAWTTLFERLAEDGNAVTLVLDDAHYADDGLLDFIDHLLGSANAGVFVLALARPELLARRAGLGGRRSTVIRLDPLDDTAMAELVDGLVDGLPAATRLALVARAEGIPLYAVETVRALIDQDSVVPREGRYVPAEGVAVDLDAIGAPATLQALVAARLDALSADERQVVADASVLGASFTRAGLAALGSRNVDDVLESLTRKEILAVDQDRFSAERGQYRFVQSVMRQVAYATQSRRDRKRRHLAAADHLGTAPGAGEELAVVIAQHVLDALDASGRTDGDVEQLAARACRLLEQAAARSHKLGSTVESLRLYETALSRATEPAAQARMHLAATLVAQEAGEYHVSVQHGAQATELFAALGDRVQAAQAVGIASYNYITLSDPESAQALAEPWWLELDGVRGAEPALVVLARTLGNVHNGRGEIAAAYAYIERRVRLAEAIDDPAQLSHAINVLGVHWSNLAAPTTARGLFETAAAIARDNDRLKELAHALNNLSTILMNRDLPAALDTLSEGLAVSRRSGAAGMIDYNRGNYVAALHTAGRLDEAWELVLEARGSTSIPALRNALACEELWLSLARGVPDPTPLEPLPAGSEPTEWELSTMRGYETSRRLAAGELDGLAEYAESVLPHLLAAAGLDDDFMHFWPELVRAALAEGDLAAAERLLVPVVDAPAGQVPTIVAAHCLVLRGQLAAARGDDPAQVEAYLRSGAGALATFGAVGFAAQAQEVLARWLVSAGRAEDGAALVAQARETYSEIGAAGWLAKLDAWSARESAAAATRGAAAAG